MMFHELMLEESAAALSAFVRKLARPTNHALDQWRKLRLPPYQSVDGRPICPLCGEMYNITSLTNNWVTCHQCNRSTDWAAYHRFEVPQLIVPEGVSISPKQVSDVSAVDPGTVKYVVKTHVDHAKPYGLRLEVKKMSRGQVKCPVDSCKHQNSYPLFCSGCGVFENELSVNRPCPVDTAKLTTPLVRMARRAIRKAREEARDAYERATAALSEHKSALNRAGTLEMWLEVYEEHFGGDEGNIAISMHAYGRLEIALGIAEEHDDDADGNVR